MTSLRKFKRHGRQERERGISTAHGHHAVLYQLRLLDDDDNYPLYGQMVQEEHNISDTISTEQWGKYMRWHDQPTLLHRLDALNVRLRSTPPRLCARLVESFVRCEYGRLEEDQDTGQRNASCGDNRGVTPVPLAVRLATGKSTEELVDLLRIETGHGC